MNEKKFVVILLIAGLWGGLAVGQTTQPGREKRTLRFVVSLNEEAYYARSSVWGQAEIVPTYIAYLKVAVPMNFGLFPAGRVPSEILSRQTYIEGRLHDWKERAGTTSAWSAMSDRQKAFIRQDGRGGAKLMSKSYTDESSQAKEVGYLYILGFYAVSESDAHKMVEGFLEYADRTAATELADNRKQLEEYRRTIIKDEAQIKKTESELKQVETELSKLQPIPHSGNLESVHNEFTEFDKLIRVIEIDIIGIQARQEAVKKIRNNPQAAGSSAITPQAAAVLDQLLMEQNIEMAGALARKRAAEERRQAVRAKYDLLKKAQMTRMSLEDLRNNLESTRANTEGLERMVADPLPEMCPIALWGNDVVIVRVTMGNEPATRPAK